jgi:hypothetical protein
MDDDDRPADLVSASSCWSASKHMFASPLDVRMTSDRLNANMIMLSQALFAKT